MCIRDSSKLDPVSHPFDLKIFAADIYKFPFFVESRQISCPVYPFREGGVQRILREDRSCLFRFVVVSVCQERSTHHDLAFFSCPARPGLFFRQQEGIAVITCSSDWQAVTVCKVSIHHVETADVRRLCRSEQVLSLIHI